MNRALGALPFLLVIFHPLAPAQSFERLSTIERKVAILGMEKYALTPDPNPLGKRIRETYFYTQQPFIEGESFFTFLNSVHWLSKDEGMLGDVFLKRGDLYNSNVLIESENRLLSYPEVRSFAVILPVQKTGSESADEVDLLVVTRDLWSFRFRTDINITGAALDRFNLTLIQTNIAGLAKRASLAYSLTPRTMEFAAEYRDPSLANSHHELLVHQGLILDRDNLNYEGVKGSVSFGLPLYSKYVKWGYLLKFDHAYEPKFRYTNGKVRDLDVGSQKVEAKYRDLKLNALALGLRSFGTDVKHNIKFGYGANWINPTFLDESISDAAKNTLRNEIMPFAEFESLINLGYDHFWNEFAKFYDLNTFSLTETFRLGPQLSLNLDLGNKAILTGDYDFIRTKGRLSYSFQLTKQTFAYVSVRGEFRYQGELVDKNLQADLFFALPKIFGAGRFVGRFRIGKFWDDRNNSVYTLGGSNGNRGYPSQYYMGDTVLGGNLEFRSSNWPLWITRIGGVLFTDFGSAFNSFDKPNLSMSVGIGLRFLVLQINRNIIRIDYAVPVVGPIRGFGNSLFTFGFGQAF